jgi:hypothetical protein
MPREAITEPVGGPTMEGTLGAADGALLRGRAQEATLGRGSPRKRISSAASFAQAGSLGPELRLRTPVGS